ncbi:MAG: hypothetical protein V2A74_13720 [bacterium]
MATIQELLAKLKEMKSELAEKDAVISEQMRQITQSTQETNGLKQRITELEDMEKAYKELVVQLEQIVE